MINSKKYSPIENVFTQDFIDKVMVGLRCPPTQNGWCRKKKAAKDTSRWMRPMPFFEAEGFFYAKPLFRGSLANACNIPTRSRARFHSGSACPTLRTTSARALWIPEAEAYVTENRLNNVISHIGEVSFPKDFGRVLGLFAKDALDDFLKEHGGEYSALDKCEQKSLNRELNNMASKFIKQSRMNPEAGIL